MSFQNDGGSYAALGVSSGKEGVHKAVKDLEKGLFPGAFCRILPDIAGDPNYCFSQHNDGAGTKAILGYLANKIRPNPKIWHGVAQDSNVMNLDDLACVGATDGFVVSMNIDRNPFNVGDEVVAELIAGTDLFCKNLAEFGITATYASGETADMPDSLRTLTVGHTWSVRMRREDVIDASRIRAGALIVGFSSTGQAIWEDGPNSGIGANGLTLARHGTLYPKYREHREGYEPKLLRTDKVYTGKYQLDDPLPDDDDFTIGSALLSPTRTYAPLIKRMLEAVDRSKVQALINCTGGGQTKIGKFGPPDVRYVKHDPFRIPPVFRAIQESSGTSWREMLKTFNMGHRLEAVVEDQETAGACIMAAEACGIRAKIVGTVRTRVSDESRVAVCTDYGTYYYD